MPSSEEHDLSPTRQARLVQLALLISPHAPAHKKNKDCASLLTIVFILAPLPQS